MRLGRRAPRRIDWCPSGRNRVCPTTTRLCRSSRPLRLRLPGPRQPLPRPGAPRLRLRRFAPSWLRLDRLRGRALGTLLGGLLGERAGAGPTILVGSRAACSPSSGSGGRLSAPCAPCRRGRPQPVEQPRGGGPSRSGRAARSARTEAARATAPAAMLPRGAAGRPRPRHRGRGTAARRALRTQDSAPLPTGESRRHGGTLR
jgi:hypothetical protein